MPRNMNKRRAKRDNSAYYLILVGVVLLFVALAVAVYTKQVIAAVVIMLIGILFGALGLSRHSLYLLKGGRA